MEPFRTCDPIYFNALAEKDWKAQKEKLKATGRVLRKAVLINFAKLTEGLRPATLLKKRL